LYLKAVYPSTKPDEPASEAIIWDAILPGHSAPWHQNHYIHPSPKSTPKSKKSKSKGKSEEVSPHPPGILKLSSQRPKYQITDISGKLQNRTDVQLELGWNVQPWVGALLWNNWQDLGMWKGLVGGKSELFNFPDIGAGKKAAASKLDVEKGKEGHRLEANGEQPRRKNN
jgi:signal peptidase complex subunit 3